MNVSKLLRNLSYGELSNLAISNEGSGSIKEEKIPQVLIHANEGLTRLYSRFVLKENNVILQMIDHVTEYHLDSEYAQSKAETSTKPHAYIIDKFDPFVDDAIKITTVFDTVGCSYVLNDSRRNDSLFTIEPLVLQVPNPIPGEFLSVNYQAKHPELVENNLDAEVGLPNTLQGALRSFIASQIYKNMGGVENTAIGDKHYADYERICLGVEDRDSVYNSFRETNTKLHERGFV